MPYTDPATLAKMQQNVQGLTPQGSANISQALRQPSPSAAFPQGGYTMGGSGLGGSGQTPTDLTMGLRRPVVGTGPGAAFAVPPGSYNFGTTGATGQQGPNALTGDFLGGSQKPLPPPNVRPPASAQPAQQQQQQGSGGFLQAPGNNMTNLGYDEQALLYLQNQMLNDPSQQLLTNQYNQTNQAGMGERQMNANLGALQAPGTGQQYWSQVGGQFNDPFAGENFTRQATQNFSPTGASSAFNQQAQGEYNDFVNYQGAGNAQGQYGTSAGQLAGGTMGENAMGNILSQQGANAQYGGPNLAAEQYAQTQGAFGDMPIANFDPFYDRARQLATQDYNRQSAGRGVYGSSEALSGVGNVITDIEAQRANRSFDAEMQRAQEQRARQQLLGEQARMGDVSGQGAFQLGLNSAQTYGNLANQAGQLELGRHELLGNMANNADTQRTSAQNAAVAGLSAMGNIANNADVNETNRYEATTGAMNAADQTQNERLRTGGDLALRTQDARRNDFDSSMTAANNAAQTELQRERQGADIAQTMSNNQLERTRAVTQAAQGAEGSRQGRVQSGVNAAQRQTDQVLNMLGTSFDEITRGGQADFEQRWQAEILPALQAAQMSQADIDELHGILDRAASVVTLGIVAD